jgi:predicted DCC family thiol-disulfide oxidoreductase YuxK
MVSELEPNPAIVLFDGVCNLCNGAVTFVIDRDPHRRFRFASLQSDYAQKLIRTHAPELVGVDSILLFQDGHFRTKSTAALFIARELTDAWPLLYVLIAVPKFLRDIVYDFVARNRYQWFGKQRECRIPTAETRDRFLG